MFAKTDSSVLAGQINKFIFLRQSRKKISCFSGFNKYLPSPASLFESKNRIRAYFNFNLAGKLFSKFSRNFESKQSIFCNIAGCINTSGQSRRTITDQSSNYSAHSFPQIFFCVSQSSVQIPYQILFNRQG